MIRKKKYLYKLNNNNIIINKFNKIKIQSCDKTKQIFIKSSKQLKRYTSTKLIELIFVLISINSLYYL